MKTFFYGTLLAIVSQTAFGTTYSIDSEATSVKFHAKGKPGFLNILGENAKSTGSFQSVDGHWTGEVSVDLTTITTGIDLRDSHMHEKYLETNKYPSATLKLESVNISGSDCEFSGTLRIKDVEKSVSGQCPLSQLDDKQIKGLIEFTFKINDYPIGVPSYLGITVADTVTIKADLIAKATK